MLLIKYHGINNPDYFFLFTYKYEHSRNRSHFFTFMERLNCFDELIRESVKMYKNRRMKFRIGINSKDVIE
jgi:hypothetical protein